MTLASAAGTAATTEPETRLCYAGAAALIMYNEVYLASADELSLHADTRDRRCGYIVGVRGPWGKVLRDIEPVVFVIDILLVGILRFCISLGDEVWYGYGG